MDLNDEILKDEIKNFYNNIYTISRVCCSADCSIDKILFKNHKSQIDVQNTIRDMKKKCKNRKNLNNNCQNIYLKRIPFIDSDKNKMVKIHIDIHSFMNGEYSPYLLTCSFATKCDDTLTKIGGKIGKMTEEQFYGSIKVSKLDQSEQEIPSNDQRKSGSFYIFHIIVKDSMGNLFVSEPFSTISFKRLCKGSKGSPSKIENFFNFYKEGKSNEIFYYFDSIFENDNNNLNFKKETIFKIDFYNCKIPLVDTFIPVNQNNSLLDPLSYINQNYNYQPLMNDNIFNVSQSFMNDIFLNASQNIDPSSNFFDYLNINGKMNMNFNNLIQPQSSFKNVNCNNSNNNCGGNDCNTIPLTPPPSPNNNLNLQVINSDISLNENNFYNQDFSKEISSLEEKLKNHTSIY